MALLADPAPGVSPPSAIPLVRPYFPDLLELEGLLEQVRESGQLTNAGPLHGRLERALREAFGWPSVALTASGTSALHLALTAFDVAGTEVITSAFTFPATVQAVLRAGAEPVLVDVGEDGITLSPEAVEAAVTERTSAVLAVHVFGFPADVHGLQAVADRHGLRLLYDAAQAIAVRKDGRDVADFGDASAFSLHATKVLHTVEGGCVVAREPRVTRRVSSLRNFGLQPGRGADIDGTNAKLSEVHAAFGLLGLQHLPSHLAARRTAYERYRALLADIRHVRVLEPPPGVEWNYGFLALQVARGAGTSATTLAGLLQNHGIAARRYFDARYLVSGVRTGGPTPGADDSSARTLCLPLWPGITEAELRRVCDSIWYAYRTDRRPVDAP